MFLSCLRAWSLLFLFASLLLFRSADAGETTWVNLMPGKDLQGWKRVPIAPDTKLADKNPWKVAGDILECDGIGIKEMLLHETERTNGVFHVKWRFRKVNDKNDYNGGVYVRTSLDGKVWHQAQVAHQDKPPRYADLFGDTLVDNKTTKFLAEGTGAKLAHPPGEWNIYDITCSGSKISVAVNGKPATAWNDCKVLKGYVGLQAEFYFIEFKNLKFKALKN
ncbi:MAG: DUF1080 domain-containing protein [Gemmataceae bacterium]|nr:DUF1080 domain-containing protein [Gemmataceae bacterium]MCI0738551.1 DUF1080 domain-containing protein [Gemmataceae bacterium]